MELSAATDAGSWVDLLCQEDAGELCTGSPAADSADGGGAMVELPEDSIDSIALFVEGAAEHSLADYPSRLRSRSADSAARDSAVSWILQVHAYYNFQPLTAYLAVNYMDRFLSTHLLPQASGWPLQLLSVACLSLAAKMEETLVPSLLDLQVLHLTKKSELVTAAEGLYLIWKNCLVQIEGARFIFEPQTICKMELLILTALKWRLRSVTPFNFINFFACKADPSGIHARYLVSSAARTILATISDIDLLDHCPSSVAAASIICAVDEAPDLDFIEPRQVVNWCSGVAWEGITDCYRLMKQAVTKGMRGRSPSSSKSDNTLA